MIIMTMVATPLLISKHPWRAFSCVTSQAMEDDWEVLDDVYCISRAAGYSRRGGRTTTPMPTRLKLKKTGKVKRSTREGSGLPKKGPQPRLRLGGSAPPDAARGIAQPGTALRPGGSAPPATAPTVSLGSDCAGLHTAHIALDLLGFRVTDEFVSENDDKTLYTLLSNFNPYHIAEDVMLRDDKALRSVDLYTAGPPCQSFSLEGVGHGVCDNRGVVFLRVLQVIKNIQPRSFMLENVLGLKFAHKAVYKFILETLQHLHNKAYRVRVRVLDARLHGGVPQSRPRLYIVGWKRKDETTEFRWPSEIPAKQLNSMLDNTDSSTLQPSTSVKRNIDTALATITQNGGRPQHVPYVVNVGASPGHGGGHYMRECSPCLTRARCAGGGHWISNRSRMMTITEMQALQGFPPNYLYVPPDVTQRQYAAMLGNAYTVGVAGRVALALLRTIGVAAEDHADVWCQGI